MKKLQVFALLMCMSTMFFAQTKNLRNADRALKRGKLDNAVEAIKLASEEAENQSLIDFWYSRAKIYTAVAGTKEPEYRGLEPNATQMAYEAFQKTFELDKEGKIKILATTAEIPKLISASYDVGASAYGEKKYDRAVQAFEICVNLCQLIEAEKTDETYVNAIFNTALCADLGKNKETAKKYYLMLTEFEANQPNAYTSLATIFKDEGNKAEALKYADLAVSRFSNDYNVLINAAGIHLLLENSDRAKQILEEMTATHADNQLVFFALGLAYEQMKIPEETEKAYLKAIELKADYFDAIFNLGAFYVNQGIAQKTEADELPLTETKKYDELTAISNATFQKAIPRLEKALEMKPNDVTVMTVLKDLYVHLKMMDKANAMNAEIEKLGK